MNVNDIHRRENAERFHESVSCEFPDAFVYMSEDMPKLMSVLQLITHSVNVHQNKNTNDDINVDCATNALLTGND